MENVQYPVLATIRAFGGPVKTGEALGVKKQNINRWRTSKSGLIPYWWSDRIKIAAQRNGITLPKPRKVA